MREREHGRARATGTEPEKERQRESRKERIATREAERERYSRATRRNWAAEGGWRREYSRAVAGQRQSPVPDVQSPSTYGEGLVSLSLSLSLSGDKIASSGISVLSNDAHSFRCFLIFPLNLK